MDDLSLQGVILGMAGCGRQVDRQHHPDVAVAVGSCDTDWRVQTQLPQLNKPGRVGREGPSIRNISVQNVRQTFLCNADFILVQTVKT